MSRKPLKLSPAGAAFIAFAPGLAFLPAAMLFNPVVLAWFSPDGALTPYTSERAGAFALIFLAAGAAYLAAYLAVRLSRGAAALARQQRLTGALFAVNAVIFAVLALDGAIGVKALRPPMPYAYYEPVYTFRFRPEMDRLEFGNALRREWLGAPLPPQGRPPDGARRILFMGDSVAFGFLLAPEDALPARLGDRLGEGWEVVNAALIGYGFDNYVYYARDLAPFRPSGVVLGLCLNDLSLATPRRLTHPPGDPRSRVRPVTELNKARWWLELNSGLMNIRRLFSERQKMRDEMEDADFYEATLVELLEDEALLAEKKKVAAAYLKDFVEVFQREGVPVMAVIFPFRFQYDESSPVWRADHRRLQAALADVCREAGVEVVDLYEPIGAIIEESDAGTGAVFMDYDHLRPEGSEAIARILAPHIERAFEQDSQNKNKK